MSPWKIFVEIYKILSARGVMVVGLAPLSNRGMDIAASTASEQRSWSAAEFSVTTAPSVPKYKYF